MTMQLPKYELYEQGGQIRRSSIKDNIAEEYGRRRYKVEDIRFLDMLKITGIQNSNMGYEIRKPLTRNS